MNGKAMDQKSVLGEREELEKRRQKYRRFQLAQSPANLEQQASGLIKKLKVKRKIKQR